MMLLLLQPVPHEHVYFLQTLVTEVQKMTATAQKRKQRLKERSLKRKGKIGKKSDEVRNPWT